MAQMLLAVLCVAALSWPLEARWVASSDKLQNASASYARNVAKSASNTSFPLERFGMTDLAAWNTSIQPADDGPYIEHWAVMREPDGEYYGAKATLNVYGLPEVGHNQASAAMIWLVNGVRSFPDAFNVIKAGWHVYPQVYGDHDTYFFVAWTADSQHKTGCVNLACKGFVLDKSSKYVPGTRIRPLSAYNGEQRYITLKISKNPQTGDWWLHAGPDGDKPVGYWPKSLFTSLSGSASVVQWGGVVGNHKGQKSPPMGSGHFPKEGEGRAASLKHIQLISETGEFYDPRAPGILQDKKDCYQIGGDKVVFFGGPGCWD